MVFHVGLVEISYPTKEPTLIKIGAVTHIRFFLPLNITNPINKISDPTLPGPQL